MNENRGTLICCLILSLILFVTSSVGYTMYTRLLSISATVNEIRKELAPTEQIRSDLESLQKKLQEEHHNSNEYFWDYGQKFVKQATEMVRIWKELKKLQGDFEAFKTAQGITISDDPVEKKQQPEEYKATEWPEGQPLPPSSE